ncbi:MAG: hemolysin family protein [Acidobacteriota bacterium]
MLATALQTTTPADSGAFALLLVYVGLALVVSFTCSILEAALLSVRSAELEDRKAQGSKGAARLLMLKRERLDDTISSILILNTLAHTFGVAGAGIQAQKVWPEGSWMLASFPIVLTVLILVLTEIIPKTLGAAYAGRIVTPVAMVTSALVWSMKPVLFLTNFITRLFAKNEETKISRGELAAMVAMAARTGTLEQPDSRLVSNVLRYHEIRVQDVMTPRTVVAMMPAEATVAELLENPEARPFSRVPIYQSNRDEVIGYVLQRQVLGALARGNATRDTTLSTFRRPALFLPETTPANSALRKLTGGHEHMALAADEYGGISGLVTLEDLMETVLGVEILDESDRVADLRVEAARLRERRLDQARRERGAEIDTELQPMSASADATSANETAADEAPADDSEPGEASSRPGSTE